MSLRSYQRRWQGRAHRQIIPDLNRDPLIGLPCGLGFPCYVSRVNSTFRRLAGTLSLHRVGLSGIVVLPILRIRVECPPSESCGARPSNWLLGCWVETGGRPLLRRSGCMSVNRDAGRAFNEPNKHPILISERTLRSELLIKSCTSNCADFIFLGPELQSSSEGYYDEYPVARQRLSVCHGNASVQA